LRAYFIDKLSVDDVAKKFNYKKSSVYSLTRDFRAQIKEHRVIADHFFLTPKPGRKPSENQEQLHQQIILLRKKYLSIPDIKSILDAQGESYSERYIHRLLKAEGFARLPRRSQTEKHTAQTNDIYRGT